MALSFKFCLSKIRKSKTKIKDLKVFFSKFCLYLIASAYINYNQLNVIYLKLIPNEEKASEC